MDDNDNPPTVSQAFEAAARTGLSTWSSKPSETYKPKPSAKIRGLIGRLGLRYHPTSQADLASHQAMLALLAEDLAEMPPDLLLRAIDRHVATSPYMPKAADLIKLAQGMMEPSTSLDDYAEQLNRTNFSKAQGWHWFVNTRSREDGWTERYLDRTDHQSHTPWTPEPGEIDAIQERIAGIIANNPGMTQAEFNQLVDQRRV